MDPSKQTPHSTPVIGSRLKALSREFEGPDNRHSSKKIPKKSFTNPRLIPEGTPVNSLFQNLMPQRNSPISSNNLTSRTPKIADSSFQYSDEIIREAVSIFKNSVGGPIDPYFVEKMAKKPSEITQLLTVANPNESSQISHPLGHKRYTTNFPQKSIPLYNHYGHNILYHSSWQTTFNPNEGNPVDHIGRTLYFEDADKKVHKIPPEIPPYHPMQRANFRNDRVNHVGLGNKSNGIQGQLNDLPPQATQNPSNNGLSERNIKDEPVAQTEKVEQHIHTDTANKIVESNKKSTPDVSKKAEKLDTKPESKLEASADAQVRAPETNLPQSNINTTVAIKKEEPEQEPEPKRMPTPEPLQPYYSLINRDILKLKKSGSEALIKLYLEIQKTSQDDGKLGDDLGLFALQSSLNSLNSKLPHKSLDLLTANGGKMVEAARDSFIQNVKSQGNDILFDKVNGVGKWKIHPTNLRKSPVSKPAPVKIEEKSQKITNNDDTVNEASQKKQSPDSSNDEVKTERGAKQVQQPLKQSSLKSKPNKISPIIKLTSNAAPSNIKQEAKPEVKTEKQLDNISLLAQNTILKPIPNVKSSVSKNDSNVFEAPSKSEDAQKSIISKKNILPSEKTKSVNPSKVKSVPMPPSDTSAGSLGVKKSSKIILKPNSTAAQSAPMKRIMVTITLPSQKQIDFQNRCFNKLQKAQKLKTVGTKPLNSKEKRVLAQSNHDDYLSTSPEYKESRSKNVQKRAREDDHISPNIDQDISKQSTNRGASKTLAKSQRRDSKQHLSPITVSQSHKEDNARPPVVKTSRASPPPQLHSSSMAPKIDSSSSKSARDVEEKLSSSQSKLPAQRQQYSSSQGLLNGVIPTATPRDMTDSLKSKISKYSEVAKAWKNKAQKVVNDPATTEFEKKQALATYVECSLMFIHNSDINDYTQEYDPSRQWMSIATMLEQAAKYLKFYDGGCLYGLVNILCAMSYSSIAFYYNKKVDPTNPAAQNEGLLKNVASYYTKSGMSLSAGIAALNIETLTKELPGTMAKCKGGKIEFPSELVYFKWASVIQFAQSVVDEYISNNKMQSIRSGQ
ncbi:hypothetical protein CONCODRAFT_79542 [Conidiobolus coronatus NRRL 28638]|uniref:Uncharacterized protein n=1 Tax=Conidiobolus coronatus (strain ATCC 28846 / CBS 209.66 / NRRL 28638) TaxID=796925 RepID=A0A137P1R0_CONC2|nr:hypothetical protein CONCODRAFT_79542 [Conidiobolus coronatus NRRL 28638]|eukprot:KXN69000.1 hypothetical protein CONCODRAFT_79542 [Conidiobolus coronatus NRRL 28638]